MDWQALHAMARPKKLFEKPSSELAQRMPISLVFWLGTVYSLVTVYSLAKHGKGVGRQQPNRSCGTSTCGTSTCGHPWWVNVDSRKLSLVVRDNLAATVTSIQKVRVSALVTSKNGGAEFFGPTLARWYHRNSHSLPRFREQKGRPF